MQVWEKEALTICTFVALAVGGLGWVAVGCDAQNQQRQRDDDWRRRVADCAQWKPELGLKGCAALYREADRLKR